MLSATSWIKNEASIYQIYDKAAFGGFWDCWLRIRGRICKIGDGGSNMTDVFLENQSIVTKFGTRWFWGVTDHESEVRFAKFNLYKICYTWVFGVADDKSREGFLKLVMMDPKWRKLNNTMHYIGFDILDSQNWSQNRFIIGDPRYTLFRANR